jgi:hypothetical protein
MVEILKLQPGRLWVFSGFLLFEMSFGALFVWGLGCSEAEFLLNNFQCICEFFYSHKIMGDGRGTRTKIIIIIEMQFVIKK